jgi:hypothetical protein
VGPGAHAGRHRVTFGVEQDRDPPATERRHETCVEIDVDARRQTAGQDAELRSSGQVVEAADE